MLLKELQLKRFGCLDDFSAAFLPGLNVIRGPNESGKTTLHQALLMALMAQPNKNKANEIWRTWGSDQWYWLGLTFMDQGGEEFQITKDFEAGTQELRVPTGETTRNRDTIEKTLERVLGTNSLLMLRSTLCVEQDALADITSGRREIAQSLEAIVTGSEDDTYTEQTLKKLDSVMREFRKGYSRMAAKPGPLAKARDGQALLVKRVTEYRTQVQSQEDDQWLLEEAKTRLAEIDQKLDPALVTQEQAQQILIVKSGLEEWEKEEKELEAQLAQVKSAQVEIVTTGTDLLALGPVAQLTEEDVRNAAELYSRGITLHEEYTNYRNNMRQYQGVLFAHQEKLDAYKEESAAYDLALSAYKMEQDQYREEMETYKAAVAQYTLDLAAYQEAWAPYAAALQAQKKGSDKYEAQRAQYQKELTVYEAELERYETVRDGQDQLLAEFERSYEEFERERDAYDQAQTDYQLAVARYETATAGPPGSVSGKIILLTIGALVVVFGIVLLILVDSVLPGAALFIVGAVLILIGVLRKSPAAQKAGPSDQERPLPPDLERPAAPQRPKYDQLDQPQPPRPLEALETVSEGLQKPDIERPEPPSIEQPSPPTKSQPEPPSPPPTTPAEPDFDKSALQSTVSQLKEILVAAGCSSIDELKERYAQAAALQAKQAAARSRLEGLLGDNSFEELLEERQEASRKRRDAQEILDQPDLQRAASMTSLEYNQLIAEINALADERTAIKEKWQRLGIRLENQPVSTEDLLRAEEALEAATAAYQQAQDRLAVYELTYEVLGEARTHTLKKAQERLEPQTVSHLQRLTRGRYRQAWIDSELNIELADPNHPTRRIQTDRLSRGAQDQLYMAARLALVDLLFPDTRPPVLLDDPFVHFDPQRLAAAIEICSDIAAERQILLFTCSDDYNQVGHHIHMPPL